MSEILKIAMSQLGVKEIKGLEHNSTIINYAHEIGLNWINDDETPWCAIFVNWVLFKAKIQYIKSAAARDGLRLGMPVSMEDAKPGDVVVFWRGDRNGHKGHEAFFLGYDLSDHVWCVGGNQGNEVSIAKYSIDHILEIRRVENYITSKLQE